MGTMNVLGIHFQGKNWAEARKQQLALVQSYLLKRKEGLLENY